MKVSKGNIIRFIIYTIFITAAWITKDKSETDVTLWQYVIVSYLFFAIYLKYRKNKNESKKKKEKEDLKRRTTIVSTYVTNVTYKEKGALTGAIIGSHFHGFLGGLIGSQLLKYEEPKYVYFNVYYEDGHNETVRAKYKSHTYNKLMRFCKN